MMALKGGHHMDAQLEKKSRGLMNNIAVQMAVLVIVAIVLIAVAAKYVW